jgi:acetylornithine aminotransferase
MELFNVYPLYDITPTKASGAFVWDENDNKYLDFYGGHGVISIGHSHPTYVNSLTEQLKKIGFYSNSVKNPLQERLAEELGRISGCEKYNLFLCNSGAEANENALKVASFVTKKKRILTFENGFHGRTSAAVAVTDNPAINAPLNTQHEVTLLPLNAIELVIHEIGKGDVAAVIIEGIQGVGGLDEGTKKFFKKVRKVCKKKKVMLILDEIQSGYGRSGEFFAFQHHKIKPDIITCAKGMANGFPIGGVLLSKRIKAKYGMLGTTFGGNHLACTAALAVLDVIEKERIIENVNEISEYLKKELAEIAAIQKVKGKGLMLGLEFDFEVAALRKQLIEEKQILTGGSANKNLLRILPPLNIGKKEVGIFIKALKELV